MRSSPASAERSVRASRDTGSDGRRARRILYVQFTNPAAYPPLEHSARILADAGWDVMFLGTGALGADRLSSVLTHASP